MRPIDEGKPKMGQFDFKGFLCSARASRRLEKGPSQRRPDAAMRPAVLAVITGPPGTSRLKFLIGANARFCATGRLFRTRSDSPRVWSQFAKPKRVRLLCGPQITYRPSPPESRQEMHVATAARVVSAGLLKFDGSDGIPPRPDGPLLQRGCVIRRHVRAEWAAPSSYTLESYDVA